MRAEIPYYKYIYGDGNSELKIIRKGFIKIPPDSTDLLQYLGADIENGKADNLMIQYDDTERQTTLENNGTEMARCDRVICPIWHFDSLDSIKKEFGSYIEDCRR